LLPHLFLNVLRECWDYRSGTEVCQTGILNLANVIQQNELLLFVILDLESNYLTWFEPVRCEKPAKFPCISRPVRALVH
jgi:hypothetical protein